MNRESITKLLGGYATGTLTPEEQAALFAAALEDHALFEALADEQALRDLLSDPAAKAHLLAALDDAPEPWYRRMGQWIFRPAGLAGLAVCATAALVFVLWPTAHQIRPAERPVVLTARRDEPPPLPAVPHEATPPKPAPPAIDAKRKGNAAPAVREFADASQPQAAPPPPPAPARAPSMEQVIVNGPTGGVPMQAEGSKKETADTAAKDLSKARVVNGVLETDSQDARRLFYSSPAFLSTAGAQARGKQSERPGVGGVVGGVQSLSTFDLGVKWSLLRQQADGQFAKVDQSDLHAGDTLQLRLEANDNGVLLVTEGGTASRRMVTAGRPVDIPLAPHPAGERNLTVQLIRGLRADITTLATTGNVAGAVESQKVEIDRVAHETYWVSRQPAGQVAFTIQLKYQ